MEKIKFLNFLRESNSRSFPELFSEFPKDDSSGLSVALKQTYELHARRMDNLITTSYKNNFWGITSNMFSLHSREISLEVRTGRDFKGDEGT